MLGAVTATDLDPVLRGVSRSIYLTLQVAPRRMRPVLGVAYLFCRAADTIADTQLLPAPERLTRLEDFRRQFVAPDPDFDAIAAISEQIAGPQQIPAERDLLLRLGDCFCEYLRFDRRDRGLIRDLVTTLTRGMELDLRYFPGEESGELRALATDGDLDLYTFYVAGCVGEFWTHLQVLHVGALRHWNVSDRAEQGIRFGKGLQLTNILRDFDQDIGRGRCYLPQTALVQAGVELEELRAAAPRQKLLPILRFYLERTLAHYASGWLYVRAIPRRCARLRLACAWPLLIGLRTLEELAVSHEPFAPGRVHKIDRDEVKRLIVGSSCRVASDRALDRVYRRLEARARGAVDRLPAAPRFAMAPVWEDTGRTPDIARTPTHTATS